MILAAEKKTWPIVTVSHIRVTFESHSSHISEGVTCTATNHRHSLVQIVGACAATPPRNNTRQQSTLVIDKHRDVCLGFATHHRQVLYKLLYHSMREPLNTALAKLKLSSGPRSIAFVSLQNALNLFKEVAGRTGVPGLQEGIKGFVILLDAVQVCNSFHLPLLHYSLIPHLENRAKRG